MDAIVCQDNILEEDLVSITSFLDNDYHLYIDKHGGELRNDSGECIHICRDDKKFFINLYEIQQLKDLGHDTQATS